MADIRKFSDLCGTVELKNLHSMPNQEFAARFPGVRGIRYDGYTMWVGHPISGTGGVLPVTRKITYKAYPSRHECNSKCLNGKVNGTCECSCGGKNHGAGMFSTLLAAA